MNAKTKIEIFRDGQPYWEHEAETDPPTVEEGDPGGLDDFSKLQVPAAERCIYCGSADTLSTEHIIPYALGGTTTVPRGSCESCRQKTQGFETAVLKGPMRLVRYRAGLPSHSKHSEVPATVPVALTIDGAAKAVDAPRDEAPILLPFPLFALPGYLEGRSALQLTGSVTGSFGADPNEFGKSRGASSVEMKVSRNDAVAFARMVAKIVYGAAYAFGHLDRLVGTDELVTAFMDDPDTIGRFVGTAPDPLTRYKGVQHRLAMHILAAHRLMFGSVQLFAAAGAPSYVVVLGRFKDDDAMDDPVA